MTDLAIKLLLVAFFAWMAWSLLQPRYAFEIRITNHAPHLHKGKVTHAFLTRVAEACTDNDVSHGWIAGVARGRHVALRFSRQFPPGCQQRLRNAYHQLGGGFRLSTQ